jgi:hypothetical protein
MRLFFAINVIIIIFFNIVIGVLDSDHLYLKRISNITLAGNVGVCIGGQVGRLMPQFLKNDLIFANSDYFFHVFYNLDGEKSLTFNTGHGYLPTKYHGMTEDQIRKKLSNMYSNSNSILHSLTFHHPLTSATYKKLFNASELNRISQYHYTQHTILNMYNYQVACMQQMKELENRLNITMDLIISTREDIYFFKPFNLTYLVTEFLTNNQQQCQVLTKSCLSNGGLNMRLQLYNRNSGYAILSNRFTFYQSMYETSSVIQNPEQFELLQINHNNLTSCQIDINQFPVTAARHVKDDQICFIEWEAEIDHCFPNGFESFVEKHKCV